MKPIKDLSLDKNRVISGLKQELNDKNIEMQAKDKEFTSYINLIKQENEKLKSQIQDSVNSDLLKSKNRGSDPYKFSGKSKLLICFLYHKFLSKTTLLEIYIRLKA